MIVATVVMAASTVSGDVRHQTAPVDLEVLETQLVEAMQTRDRRRLESLLAPDFVLRGTPDLDRATWLDNAMLYCWGDQGDVDALESRDYGGVAVAAFELTFYVDPRTCRPALFRSLITDVWVFVDGAWTLKVRHAGAPPSTPGDLAAQYGAVPQPPPRWQASSELSAVATGGTTSTRTLGVGAQVTHRARGRRTEVRSRFLTSQADGATNARAFSSEARHGFDGTERLRSFGEVSYARNRFAGIDDRAIATVGAAYAVRLPRAHALSVEGGLGWTFEQRLDSATLRFATATGAFDYRWRIAPQTELRQEARFTADLESTTNWRTATSTELTVGLTRVLSLRASHVAEYRNRPVAGFGRADLRTAVALVFSLTRLPAVR